MILHAYTKAIYRLLCVFDAIYLCLYIIAYTIYTVQFGRVYLKFGFRIYFACFCLVYLLANRCDFMPPHNGINSNIRSENVKQTNTRTLGK